MRLAFLISAHTDAPQLQRLVRALPPSSHCFIHVDKSVDIRPFADALPDDNVTFVDERIQVVWGSFRQVRYQMSLINAALASGKHFDFLVSLSGLDFPVLPPDRLLEFFEQHKGQELLQAIDLTRQPEHADTWRLYGSYRFFGEMPWRYGSLGSKFRVALREAVWHTGKRKPLTFTAQGRTYRLHKGSSWWAISMSLARYVADTWAHNPEYCRYFRNSFGCDETFIHTLAFNYMEFADKCIHTEGEFKDLEQVTPLTYIHYKPEIKILTEEDYDTILSSGKVFCRKVVSGKSDGLVRKIQADSAAQAVSLLVPIYNVEQYIGQCAESLFAQTYTDIEYVFVNDCTPDHSIEVLHSVIERYPDRKPHVRIINNERNTGIGGVRRRLIDEVKTEFFCFVDSDDILPPDAVETMVYAMQKSGADIVDGAYCDYDRGAMETVHLPYSGSANAYLRRLLCQNIIKNNLWAKLYRSTVLTKVPDLFVEGINYTEDFCAMSRLAAVTKRMTIDDVIYCYRIDNQSSYTKNVSQRDSMSYFRGCHEVLRFYIRRGHLPMALEIGMLNIYRECHRRDIPVATAENIVRYVPEHLTAQFLRTLLTSRGITYTIGDYLYRLIRRSVL